MSADQSLAKVREQGAELYDKLRTLTFPLGVRFLEHGEDMPEGVFRPSAYGKSMTLCQGFTLARRSGASVGFTADDNVCLASTAAHGWKSVDPLDMLKSQEMAGYHAGPDAEAKVGMTRKMMPAGRFYGMVISPLPKTEVLPQVVLVYGNPTAIHHLIASLTYHGRVINSNFYSTGESCIKGLIETYLTDGPQVVIPGLGDRVTSMTGEDEMLMGIPAALLSEAVENLFAGKIGQPVAFLMPDVPDNLTPAWPYLREKMSPDEEK